MLNIGCGSTFHPDWINIDVVSTDDHVIEYDLRKGLPFDDNSLDVCYHSHVLEHLTRADGQQLIKECVRVLKPGGILRVATPDLEKIILEYKLLVDQADTGDLKAEHNYNWIMLELYDQFSRRRNGGDMLKYLTNPSIPNADYVKERMGPALDAFLNPSQSKQAKPESKQSKANFKRNLAKVRNLIAGIFVRFIAGKESLSAFQEGLFINSGETHRTMYDRFSMRRLFRHAGLADIKICQANESNIPKFESFSLDTIHGAVRKADSIFVEGIKTT